MDEESEGYCHTTEFSYWRKWSFETNLSEEDFFLLNILHFSYTHLPARFSVVDGVVPKPRLAVEVPKGVVYKH